MIEKPYKYRIFTLTKKSFKLRFKDIFIIYFQSFYALEFLIIMAH